MANGTFGRKDWGFRVGQVVASWTVLSEAYRPRLSRDVVHDCRCECGYTGAISASSLFSGKSTRCRTCARPVAANSRKLYNGYVYICPDDKLRSRLLGRISAAIQRCRDPKDKGFPNYGGRGVRVHPPWVEARHEFLAYLMTLEGHDDPKLDMDRIDTDGNYEPGNLRFVTRAVNTNNRRTVQRLQYELDQLKARLRHCKCGATEPLHGSD